jgi:glucosamine-6-phosphate deaminase
MDLRIHATRSEMGKASAQLAADTLLDLIRRDGRAVAVFASAVSQNEFLDALAGDSRIDWSKVVAFHMDEYIGIGADHPASFRRFQHEHMWSRVKPAVFHEINGDARDVNEESARYAELLEQEKPSVCFAGIGENGHLAFNDPPADFNDPQLVRVVQLDEVCRQQQVHDGAFRHITDVPKTALTLTIPALVRIPKLILNVPGPNKARAVQCTVEGPVTPECPASILQNHPDATLFVDREAASLLTGRA